MFAFASVTGIGKLLWTTLVGWSKWGGRLHFDEVVVKARLLFRPRLQILTLASSDECRILKASALSCWNICRAIQGKELVLDTSAVLDRTHHKSAASFQPVWVGMFGNSIIYLLHAGNLAF